MEQKYLVMVTDKNNNKYYSMKQFDGDSFEVEWGRVGYPPQKKTFPMSQWDKKFNSKIKKGYIDQTNLFKKVEGSSKFTDISDSDINEFVNLIISYSKKSVNTNYTIDAANVTKEQIDQAQSIIDSLVTYTRLKRVNLTSLNDDILKLYMTIPRKMKKVQDHLLSGGKELKTDLNKLIQSEQDTLDSMSAQNSLAKVETKSTEPDQTLLDAFGLEFRAVDQKSEISAIKKHLQDSSNVFRRAFKVKNIDTRSKYDNHTSKAKNKDQVLFWHGSRNENWFSILQTGLLIRPSCAVLTGAMFGNGIYFAPRAKKSIGYTSRRGSYWVRGSSDKAYLALFNVHVGRKLRVERSHSWCYSMDSKKIAEKGYDSLWAEKKQGFLFNDEVIVYNTNQCTIEYIVEIG